jgi:GntR family transcriptional regulator
MSGGATSEDSKPLYAKVRALLMERIRSGVWRPGQLIPNEFEIAAEFGVSQGTARKALDALAAEKLVVRRQGRGTFVVEHTPANVMFRFFSYYTDDGRQIEPDSIDVRHQIARATKAERQALDLGKDARVVRIQRTRTWRGRPFISETISLPDNLFPALGDRAEIPNTLYDLFHKDFSVLVARADERVTAIAADASTAAVLSIAEGSPLLKIDRKAFTLDDRVIEWRVSFCLLTGGHYFARLK